MSVNISITIDSSKYQGWLVKIPATLNYALVETTKKALGYVERFAKQGAPVDTGRLRASIGGGTFKGGSYGKGEGVIFTDIEASIRPTVNYAVFVHEGTRYMTGRPFMSNAADKVADMIQDILDREVRKVLS